jgi:hypothetical protein
MVVHTCNPSYEGDRVGGLRSEAGEGKSSRPYLKNKLKQNRGEGMAQVVEHLSSKSKTLSSNPNSAKKKKKKKQANVGLL